MGAFFASSKPMYSSTWTLLPCSLNCTAMVLDECAAGRRGSGQLRIALFLVTAGNGPQRFDAFFQAVAGAGLAAAAAIEPAGPALDDDPLLEQVLHQHHGVHA